MRLLDETPAVLLLPILCSNTDIHLSGNRWNSTIDEKLEVNYLYNGQLRASCRAWTVIWSSSSLSSTSRSTDIFFRKKLGTIIRPSHDSKWQACMRETDADRAWQAGRGKPWTNMRKFFQTRCTRRIQRKIFLIGYSPSQLISRTWRSVLADSSERVNTDSEGDASKVETQKTEAQYSCLLPQIPKEIYSTNRRDWWLDNSGAQNPQRRMWISEQSPVRCRGTRSHHSVDITRVKTELHRRRRRIFMEVFREAISHRLETWNCRTSCTPSTRRDISVLLQSGLNEEWWSDSMKCFYYLQNVQNLLANGKSQIWTKIWRIIQRTNCTIWRTGWISPRTPRKIKQEFINLEKIITRNCYWFCLIPWWESGKNIFQLLRLKNLEIWRHWNIFQKTECEGSSENPKRWRICIFCSRWFTKNIRKKLQIPRTHYETGFHRKEREYQRRISRR